MSKYDTICAVSTAQGTGAIAVIRLSGKESFPTVLHIFKRKGELMDIKDVEPYKAYYGEIFDPLPDDKPLIDEVLVTFSRLPTPTPAKIWLR